MKLYRAVLLVSALSVINSLSAATASIDDVIVSKNGSDPAGANSSDYPVKICVGALGYSRAKGGKSHGLCKELKGEAYQACMRQPGRLGDYANLKINGKYIAPAEAVIRLKRQAYQFSSGEGSFKFDFRKTDNSIFRIDVAHYGGISIDPIKVCGKN